MLTKPPVSYDFCIRALHSTTQEMLSPGQSSCCNVWDKSCVGCTVYQDQDEVVMLSPLCLVPGKSYFVCPVSVAVTWNKSEAFCQKSEEVLLLSCPRPSTRHHVQENHQRPWPLCYSTPLFFRGDSSHTPKIRPPSHFVVKKIGNQCFAVEK